MNVDIVAEEHNFWASFTVANLYNLYNLLTTDPEKLLRIVEEPPITNPGQERVYNYLRQYISLLPNDKLQVFLRFITGSTGMPTYLRVTYNTLMELPDDQ